MSYFIIAWLVLLLLSLSLGIALLNLSQIRCFERAEDRVIIAVWLGVITLSNVLLAIAAIFPLSPLTGAFVAGSLCLVSLLLRQSRTELITLALRLSLKRVVGFLILMIAIAALTTRPVTWQDTGYYHYQVIQWLAKFGIVPGIALLFPNFGFTSSWFALAAPLNAEVLDSRVSAVTNGFVFLIATLQCFICFAHCLKRKARLSDWFMVACSLLLIPVVVFAKPLPSILVSPSPDIPVIFLVEIIAWSTLVLSESRFVRMAKNKSAIDAEVIPLFLSAGAITLKLTALPVLFISSLFLVLNNRFKLRTIVVAGILVTLLLAPMLLSGAMTSGCPIYPSSLFCLDLPWTLTQESAERVAKGSYGLTNWVNAPPPGIHPLFWALWQWFTSSLEKQLMALLMLFSIFPAIYLARKVRLDRFYALLWTLSLAVFGSVFIALQAPFFRFAVPYLFLSPALGIAVYFQSDCEGTFNWMIERSRAWFTLKSSQTFLSMLCIALTTLIITAYTRSDDVSRIFLPPRLQRIPLVVKRVNDVTYFSPVRDVSCWATQLPCTGNVSPNIKLRRPEKGIAGGFIRFREQSGK